MNPAAQAASTTHDAPDGFQREPILLKGRKVVGGSAAGKAMVTRDHISGWGGVDPRSGTIIETHHELRDQSFSGKVLLFPGAKGSSGWSNTFHLTRVMGTAPAAMLFVEMTTKVALGAVVTHAPSVTDFDADPFDVIQTGDWVQVDGDLGVVRVFKRSATDPGLVKPGQ